MASLPLVHAVGGRLPGAVGVVSQHHTLGEATQRLEVVLSEGRAAGRDGAPEADPEQGDHVGIALAHDRLTRLDHVSLGPVEPVERPALRVDRRLGRVLVLGPASTAAGVAGRQDPPTEGDRATAGVEDREQHAGPERVLLSSQSVDEPEARLGQHIARHLERPSQRIPVVGGPTQGERTHG